MRSIRNKITKKELVKIYTKPSLKGLAYFLLEKSNKERIKSKYRSKSGDLKIPYKYIEEVIESTWNYELALKWTREELTKVDHLGRYKQDKFSSYKSAEKNYNHTLLNYKSDWLTYQGSLDGYIQQLNRNYRLSQSERLELAAEAAKQHLLKSQFNNFRNDFLEYELLKKNSDIFPTLKHSSGVDFFIQGIAYDQKVSRSLGKSFLSQFKTESEAIIFAKKHPELLAESLFNNQDVARFDPKSPNRLYIVFLSEAPSKEDIINAISKVDLKTPYKIKGKIGDKEFLFKSFVILI